MGFSHNAGAEAFARQARDHQNRLDTQRNRIRNRMADRARLGPDPLDRHAEALACPRCGTHYEFGRSCPDCQVMLVGASAAAITRPDPVGGRRFTGREFLHMLVITGLTWTAVLGLIALMMVLD